MPESPVVTLIKKMSQAEKEIGALQTREQRGWAYDTTMSGAANTVTISNIPQVYRHLRIILNPRSSYGTAAGDNLYMSFGGFAAGSYDSTVFTITGGGASASATLYASNFFLIGGCPSTAGGTTNYGRVVIDIPDYQNIAKSPGFISSWGYIGSPGANAFSGICTGTSRVTGVVSSITFFATVALGGQLVAGTRLTVYGLG